MVQERAEATMSRKRMDAERARIVARVHGKMQERKRRAAQSKLVASKLKSNRLDLRLKEADIVFQEHERAFSKVTKNTGIRDVDEMVTRLTTHSDTMQRLQQCKQVCHFDVNSPMAGCVLHRFQIALFTQ